MSRRFAMQPNSLLFTIFLGVLAALPALSIDISAPTLALLPDVLETSKLVAGLTISLFMVGFALGQVSGGSLSDRHGRKPVLLVGFAIYTLASVVCALSTSGVSMVASRLVQGVGAGTCAVMSFAIVQDLFQGAAARSKRAYVTVVVGAAPILAPALGSVIVDVAGWRAVHVVLAVAGIVLLAIVWSSLAESHTPRQQDGSPAPDRRGKLRQDAPFLKLVLVNALSYGAVFAYIAGSPVVVMDYYRGSQAIYAAVFAWTAVALTGGAWTGGRLARRGMPAENVLSIAMSASTAAAVGLAAACLTSPAISGPIAIGLMGSISFCRGMISPNLQHLAIERQRDRAGTASAVVGLAQLLGGALSSVAVAALLSGFGPVAVAGPIVLCSITALGMWWWTARGGLAPQADRPRAPAAS